MNDPVNFGDRNGHARCGNGWASGLCRAFHNVANRTRARIRQSQSDLTRMAIHRAEGMTTGQIRSRYRGSRGFANTMLATETRLNRFFGPTTFANVNRANTAAQLVYDKIGAEGQGFRGQLDLSAGPQQESGGYRNSSYPGRFFLVQNTIDALGVTVDGRPIEGGNPEYVMRVFGHEARHDVRGRIIDEPIPNAPAGVGAPEPGSGRTLAYGASGAEYYQNNFPDPLQNNDNLICIYVGCR